MVDVGAVILGTGGGHHRLEACVAGLQRHIGSLKMEIVVVDTGSGAMANYAEEHMRGVRVLRCPQRSTGYAYNRALETVDARYALLMTSDVDLLEGSVSEIASVMDSVPNIAVAGVRQVRSDDSLAPSIGRFPSSLHALAEATGLARLPGARRFLGELIFSARGYKLPRTCDWTSSSMMFVRMAALDSIGWFDERLLRLEETDLCWRLRRQGWEVVYLPCMTARNHHLDRLENARAEAEVAYARMQFARKYFPLAAAEYRWALALRYALRIAAFSFKGRYENHRKRAAKAALDTVIKGHPPFDAPSFAVAAAPIRPRSSTPPG